MSWHYSQALVAEYLEENSSDGKPSAQWKKTPIAPGYCSSDRMTDFSRLSRFGMTFAPLTESLGAELLTWFLADFPVRTSAPPEQGKESPETEVGSGWKWRESSVKYDPSMRLWKTRQYSLLGGSEWFSETWPRWGLMRDGESWELPMSARHIYVRESGLLPTPLASDGISWKKTGKKDPLPGILRTLRNGSADRVIYRFIANGQKMSEAVKYQEMMMGWPSNWTALKPLEMPKSPNAPQKHGES